MSFMLPVVGDIASSLISGGLNFLGTREQNLMARDMAREQMKFQKDSVGTQMQFQERMSSTAYQRAVQDMRSAGINPILAAGGGASTPGGASAGGASAPVQNELAGIVSSALGAKRTFEEIANLKAQRDKLQADTEISKVDAKLLEAQVPGAELDAKIDKSSMGPFMRWMQRMLGIAGGAASTISQFSKIIPK